VKGGLSQQLMAKKQQDGLEQFIEGLKKKYKVEIKQGQLRQDQTRRSRPAVPTKPAAAEQAPDKAPVKAPEPEKNNSQGVRISCPHSPKRCFPG